MEQKCIIERKSEQKLIYELLLKENSSSQTIAKPNVSGSIIRKSKFLWKYRYVEEGQLNPDEHNRWAIDCYMLVHIKKALPKYDWVKEMIGKAYMPVRVATMVQKGSGFVPSTVHNFCVTMPTFEDAGNIGFSHQRNFFSNDIEELKRVVEKEFNHIRTVFRYCR
jgi:hypothetical protein